MQVRKMRILRMKYNIPMAELASVCGISIIRIREIEMKIDSRITSKTAAKIADAFFSIADRKHVELQRLYQDIERCRDSLMDCVEEYSYEL